MIDYSINLYSIILLAIMVGSALYALGQWTHKTEDARDSAASKSQVDANDRLMKDRMADLGRRVLDLERNMVRQGEFVQFQHRVDALERNVNARLDDRS